MPEDSNLRHFPTAGFSIPSESPFYPTIVNQTSGKKVRFNQGYVFDYQSYGEAGINKLAVEMDELYPAEGKFYVEIKTGPKTARVTSAKLIAGEPSLSSNFHYSADRIKDGYTYTNGQGEFHIPVCSFDENFVIENIYLRENIHWQKINFSNLAESSNREQSHGVLYNWGNDSEFSENPNVYFARIEQYESEGSWPEGKEKVIKLDENEGKITVTTQFPEIPDYETSILVRKKENNWEWLSPTQGYTQLLLHRSSANALEFFDVNEGCFFYVKNGVPKMLPHPDYSEGYSTLLTHEGDEPYWETYEKIQVQICKDGYPTEYTILGIPTP